MTQLRSGHGGSGGPVDAIYDQVRRRSRTEQAAPVTPTPAAACVLWRWSDHAPEAGHGAAPALEVYLVQRAFQHPFLGGFWSFPGGGAAPGDADHLAACVREVREETGLDLAALAADRFVPLARFVTPAVSPLRYDARFFLVEAPPGAAPDPTVSRELRDGRWLSPGQAVSAFERGDLLMAAPVLSIVTALARGGPDGAPAALAGARAEDADRRLWPVAAALAVAPLRTLTLPPATHTNAYVVGGSELAVIDPGSDDPAEQAALDHELDRLVGGGARVVAILLTHHHLDHASGAAHLARRTGAPVLAHPATAERLAGRVEIARTLADGDVIDLAGPPPRRLRALFTPGHAPGHLCFVEEHTGFAAVGDMVASVGTILIDPSEGDMAEYLGSLERLAGLGLRALLPAHGAPIVDAAGKLAEYRRHRLWREEQVAAALARRGADGPVAAAELVPLAYADVSPAIYGLAERSLLAHLVKLADEGRARRVGQNWVVAG